MRREVLLDAAAASLRERGLKRFSVDELSRTLHISKRTIYDFFENKRSLVESAVDYMLCRLVSEVEYVGRTEPNSLRGLLYSVMAGVRFFCSMPLRIYSEIKECGGCNEIMDRMTGRVNELYSRNMERAADDGYIERGLKFETVGDVIRAQFIAQYADDYDTNAVMKRSFNILVTILYGIATGKGKAEMENIIIRGL